MANRYAAFRNVFGRHIHVEVFRSEAERDHWLAWNFSCDPIDASEAKRIAQRSGMAFAHGGAEIPASWGTRHEVWKKRWDEADERGCMAYDLMPVLTTLSM